MPTLENASGRDFLPNIAAAFDKTVAGFERQAEKEKAAQKQADIDFEVGILAAPEGEFLPEDVRDARIRLAALDPKVQAAVESAIKADDAEALAEANQMAAKGVKNASFVLQQETEEGMKEAWREVIRNQIAEGKASQAQIDEGMSFLGLDKDAFRLKMEHMIAMGTDIGTLTKPKEGFSLSEGQTRFGPDGKKIAFVPKPEKPGDKFVDLMDEKGNVVAQRNERTNEFKPIKGAGGGDAFKRFSKGQALLLKDAEGNHFTVTSVLDQVSGKVNNVVTPVAKGALVSKLGETAEETRKLDIEAEVNKRQGVLKVDLEMLPKIEGAKLSTKQRLDASNEAFKKLPGLDEKIDLYDRAITLVKDKGADTGTISNMMPSFRAATLELQNIQQQLGLNILSSVTMGSLSENEMDILLSTAIPLGINEGPELVDWLERRKAATEKLRSFTEDAVIFLRKPDSTLAGFIAKKRKERKIKKDVAASKTTQANPSGEQQIGRFKVKVR